MSDLCKDSLPCDDAKKVEVPSTSNSNQGFNHVQNITQTAKILGKDYILMSFKRTFSAKWGESGDSGIYAVVEVSPTEQYPCVNNATNIINGVVSEDCVQELIIPYYLNLTDKIFVYKKITETIKFGANCHPKKASFKMKFGYGEFWKFVIKKSDKEILQCKEEFHVVQDDEDIVVHTVEWDKNPFELTGPMGSTGLLGEDIIKVNVEENDPSVRQILLFPIVPSQAIPVDLCGAKCAPSVNNYGFYDYNESEAGAIGGAGNRLGEADGGKDMFYPQWLRAMTPNPIMQAWANERWMVRWYHQDPPPPDSKWVAPDPVTYNWPFGSFVKDKDGNYIHSALFTDRNGNSFVYNKSNVEDIFTKIDEYGQKLNDGEKLYYPITLIADVQESPRTATPSQPLKVKGEQVTNQGEPINV